MCESVKVQQEEEMTHHRLVVDRPLCDGNDLEHDGALRPGLLIGCEDTQASEDYMCSKVLFKVKHESGETLTGCSASYLPNIA